MVLEEDDRRVSFQQLGDSQNEIISTYAYPRDAGRATGVPMERLRFDFKNGVISSEDSGFSADIGQNLGDNNAKAVRSITLFSDVPIVLKSATNDQIPLTGGNVHIIREISEKEVVVDLSVEADNCDPEECALALIASNNPRPQYVPDTIQISSPVDKDGITVDNSSFAEVFSRYVSPTTSYRVTVENTGAKSVDLELRSFSVDNEVVESSTSIGSGDTQRFTVSAPMGVVLLYARESTGGNSTSIDVEYEAQV